MTANVERFNLTLPTAHRQRYRASLPPLARQGFAPDAGLSCLTDESIHRAVHAAPVFFAIFSHN